MAGPSNRNSASSALPQREGLRPFLQSPLPPRTEAILAQTPNPTVFAGDAYPRRTTPIRLRKLRLSHLPLINTPAKRRLCKERKKASGAAI